MESTTNVQAILDELQTTISKLERTQEAKQTALRTLDTAALHSISEQEHDLTEALIRQTFPLDADACADNPAASLAILLARLPASTEPAAQARIRNLRSRIERLKRSIAQNWLATWRLNEYVGDMLTLIAQAGRPAATAHHGLVFDSTA